MKHGPVGAVGITGSSGLIGQALVAALEQRGQAVTRLRRGQHWDPDAGTINAAALEGHSAVIHLAGESIAGLWTRKKKQEIRESREKGTRLVAEALAGLKEPPSVLISASAIGYYGDRPPAETVDESDGRGEGFLAEVVEAWESSTAPARDAGIRVANMRFGLVLSPEGGMMKPMLPVFRLGLGGPLGNGRQMWSWVALDDVVGAILFTLDHPELSGPVNVVAPQPVSNKAFTRTLGRVLRRPTLFTVPAFLMKATVGQAAEELVLFGVRVEARKLREAGYVFRYPELEVALRHLLSPE